MDKRPRKEVDSPSSSKKTKKPKNDSPSEDETEQLQKMIAQLQQEKEQMRVTAEHEKLQTEQERDLRIKAEQEKEQAEHEKLKAQQEKEQLRITAEEKEQLRMKAQQEKEQFQKTAEVLKIKVEQEALKRIQAEKQKLDMEEKLQLLETRIWNADGKVFANMAPSSATREKIKPICLESRVGNHPGFLWTAQMVYQEEFREKILIDTFGIQNVLSFRDNAREMIGAWKRIKEQREEKASIGPFAIDRSETITTAVLTHPFSAFVHQWQPVSNGGRFEAYHEFPLIPSNTLWDNHERPPAVLPPPASSDQDSSKKRTDRDRGELDLVVCYFPNKDKLDCNVPLFIEAGLGVDKDPQAFLYATYLDRLCSRYDMEQYKAPYVFLGITINVDHNNKEFGRFRLNAYCRVDTKYQPKLAECFICEGPIDFLSLVLEVAWGFAKYQSIFTGKTSALRTVDIRTDDQGKKCVFKTYGKPGSASKRSWQFTQEYLHGECIDISPHIKVIKYPYIEGSHWASSPRQFLPIIEQLQQLHLQNIVHGDIRRYNIVFSPTASTLIDFDFSGPANQKTYPIGYSQVDDCDRHPNALPEQPLQFEHDVYSLISVMKRHSFADSTMQQKWSEINNLRSLVVLKSFLSLDTQLLDQSFIPNRTIDGIQTATDRSPQP